MKKLKNFIAKKGEALDFRFSSLVLGLVMVIASFLIMDLIKGLVTDYTYQETPIRFDLVEEGESLKAFDLSYKNLLHSDATFEKDGEKYKRQIISYDEVYDALGFAFIDSEEIVFVSSIEEQGIEIYIGEKSVFPDLKLGKIRTKRVVIKVFVQQ